jgi:hypothetical protein
MSAIKKIAIICEFIVSQLREELIQQGHKNKGELAASLSYTIKATGEGYIIDFYGKDYAKYVNFGIRQGKWVSVYALAKWVEEKGIASGEKEIKNAAFAIRNAIHREGSPTDKAKEHSKNGERLNFVGITFDGLNDYILNELFTIFSDEFTASMDNILELSRKDFEANE